MPSPANAALASVTFILRSATSEVNDLAWVLSEWNHHWYKGATWLAAVWPLPATVSSLKNTYVLTSVTKDIVGISREFESGGLQISMFGEAYLNFGYVAVIGLGLLFGFLVRKFNGLVDWAKSQGPLILFPCMCLDLAGLYQGPCTAIPVRNIRAAVMISTSYTAVSSDVKAEERRQ
ncbi:MAG: hypothetical protein WCC25_07155 [Candidatus Korobacteraceae bacterium]